MSVPADQQPWAKSMVSHGLLGLSAVDPGAPGVPDALVRAATKVAPSANFFLFFVANFIIIFCFVKNVCETCACVRTDFCQKKFPCQLKEFRLVVLLVAERPAVHPASVERLEPVVPLVMLLLPRLSPLPLLPELVPALCLHLPHQL